MIRATLMKTLFWIAGLALITQWQSAAGPLVREHVSPQAKWVIHFDAEHFRTTKFGEFYVENVLESSLAEAKVKFQFDFGPLIRSLKSATAYGTEYQKSSNDSGVLLLQASPSAVDDVGVKLAAWLALENSAKKKSGRIRQLMVEPFAVYQVDKETIIAPLPDGRLLFGKSRQHVQKAAEVVLGKSPNLASTSLFADWNAGDEGFILAAAVDDLNKNAALSPHAKIFRQTDQGRLVLAERGEQLTLNVSLHADSAESAARVKKLIEGLVAWAEMEKAEDPELQLLAKSAQVSVAARTVNLGLAYPVERVMKKMADDLKKTPPAKPGAK